jgi:hypothetical protein
MPFDGTARIATLSRPRLLAAAGRAAAALYRREKDLAGLIPGGGATRDVAGALMAAEAACEADRRAQAPRYAPARHVRLLGALIAETAPRPA